MASIQKTHYFDTLDEAQEFRERFEMDFAGYHPIATSPELVAPRSNEHFAGYHPIATSPELVAPRSNEHFVAYTQHTGKYVVHTDRMSSCD